MLRKRSWYSPCLGTCMASRVSAAFAEFAPVLAGAYCRAVATASLAVRLLLSTFLAPSLPSVSQHCQVYKYQTQEPTATVMPPTYTHIASFPVSTLLPSFFRT